MIQWSLTLTQNQIAILEALEDRVFGEEHEGATRISHYIVGTRALEREGLLEYHDTRNAKTGYTDSTRTGMFITDRGRFILNMIREDMARFIKDTDRPRRKRAGKADAA